MSSSMTHFHTILTVLRELLIRKKKNAASTNVSAFFDFSKVLPNF